MPSILDAALEYAQLGWRVLPLHNVEPYGCSCGRLSCQRGGKEEKSIGKHPRTGKWQIDATTDLQTIRKWWLRWPAANVGIATGAASGIIVLDVDVHRDAPGFASLTALETELGVLPRTLTQTTGSGGEHRIFQYPDSIAICNSAAWRGKAGIDWRGDGGQIVVAPSIALAGPYKWKCLEEIAMLPATWIAAHIEYEASRAQVHSRTKGVVPPIQIADIAEVTPEDLIKDDAVIADVSCAANAEKFKALWDGRWEALGYESQSNADLALCSILAFWCDQTDPTPHPDRIDRIFRRSGLYRGKWDREDYRTRTLLLAVQHEEQRRADDASFHEMICGELIDTKITQKAVSSNSQNTPKSVDNSTVRGLVKKLVHKKKNSKSLKSKFDADMIENFMSGEKLVSDSDVARFPTLSKLAGIDGLHRVAWVLGATLTNISWDAVINTRAQHQRFPWTHEQLQTANNSFTKGQIKAIRNHDQDQNENRIYKQKIRHFHLTGEII